MTDTFREPIQGSWGRQVGRGGNYSLAWHHVRMISGKPEIKCSALHSVRRLLAQWAGFRGSPVGLDEHGDDGRGDETSSGLDEDCS